MSIFAMVVIVASSSFAQDAPRDKGHRKHKSILADIPDLTEDQKTQIKEIKMSRKDDQQKLRDEQRVIREKMTEMKSSDQIDLNAMNALIDEEAKIRAAMKKNRVAGEMEVRKILTEEQRAKLDAKHTERRAMHEKKRAEHKQMKETK